VAAALAEGEAKGPRLALEGGAPARGDRLRRREARWCCAGSSAGRQRSAASFTQAHSARAVRKAGGGLPSTAWPISGWSKKIFCYTFST
jgi:hypothetical protein